MRGFRRAYKQGEREGEGRLMTGCIFCLQVDGPLTVGGRGACTWGGLTSGSLGYCVKAL